MGLSAEERDAVVAYRLEKSEKALEQAKGNLPLQYWEVIANRLYYAAFYAVSALLVSKGHVAHTHNGVIQLFGLHFIKAELIDVELGKHYSRLLSLRLTGDYDDSYNLSEQDITPLIKPTERLITEVKKLINSTPQ